MVDMQVHVLMDIYVHVYTYNTQTFIHYTFANIHAHSVVYT